MGSFRLARPAQDDLKQIYLYGLDRWGEKQADFYYNALFDMFEAIAADPLRYPVASEIEPGYRRAVFKSHSIYFETGDDYVEIIGIIRSQDTRRLGEQ